MVLEQVHQLTRSEQLALIASIAQMIGDDEQSIFPDEVIRENNRRLAAYDTGQTQGIPYQEAMREIRNRVNPNK